MDVEHYLSHVLVAESRRHEQDGERRLAANAANTPLAILPMTSSLASLGEMRNSAGISGFAAPAPRGQPR
jgi:hypothetical protein